MLCWPLKGSRWIDLSHRLGEGTPSFPGDPPFTLASLASVGEDGYSLTSVQGTFHSGTHLDVPAHFIPHGRKVADFPVDHWIGQAIVVDATGRAEIGTDVLDGLDLGSIRFLLIRTGWSDSYGEPGYFSGHPVLSESLATYLASTSLAGIGMDMPGPDHDPYPIHGILLGHGLCLVENLTRLSDIPERQPFLFLAIPPPVEAEACWVRALALIGPVH